MEINTIGFLGMGIMGQAMALNLIKNGFKLVVWNRDAAKCAPLAEAGAEVESSPCKVVAAAEVTFAMLADPPAAESVCFGPEGVLEGLEPGKAYVDFSTVDEFTSRNIAEAINEAEGLYLEAPVSGSKGPAENGQLVILAAGDKPLFDDLAGIFEVLGKKSIFLGEVGQGSRMKLVVNMIMGGVMGAFCEGISLSDRCGLKSEDLLDVLGAGALANPMFAGKGPQISRQDFTPAFPLKHMHKDLRLAVELGEDKGQCLNLSTAALELFKEALDLGFGDEDFCAVSKSVKD